MNEQAARTWIVDCFGHAAAKTLARFVELLLDATDQQNLIAASTREQVWSRHIVDSAQLLTLVTRPWHSWLDVGSGAGLPGLVVAILSGKRVTLVEPRRLRVEFLQHCCDALKLDQVHVELSKVERVERERPLDIISARAVASLERLLGSTRHLADRNTTFVLPKGTVAHNEVAQAKRSWHGMFHVEQSVVEPTSHIVVASGLMPR